MNIWYEGALSYYVIIKGISFKMPSFKMPSVKMPTVQNAYGSKCLRFKMPSVKMPIVINCLHIIFVCFTKYEL